MRRELAQYPLHVMTVYPAVTATDMMKTAVVRNVASAQDVAHAAVEGLLNGEINVILGRPKREEQIELNFLEPKKIDEVAKANFEALRERTQSHRSM